MQGTECVRDQTVKQIAAQHPGQALEIGPTVGSGAQVEVQRIEGKVITQYETPYAASAAVQGPVGPVAVGEKETIGGYGASAQTGLNEGAATVTQTTTLPTPPMPSGGQVTTGVTGGVSGLQTAETTTMQTQQAAPVTGAMGYQQGYQQTSQTITAGAGTKVQLQAGTQSFAYECPNGQWKAIVPVDLGASRPASGSLGPVYSSAEAATGAVSGNRVKVQLEAGAIAPLFEVQGMGFVAVIPVAISRGIPGTAGQAGLTGTGAAVTGTTGTTGMTEEVAPVGQRM